MTTAAYARPSTVVTPGGQLADLVIDPEFQSLIPPLSPQERGQLEANIIEHGGARDPLTAWATPAGDWVLLDGHNRHAICTRLGLPYRVESLVFADRDAAADWIDRNQLGRRNLTADAFTLLLGRRYARAKKAHGGARVSSGQNDHMPERTAERIATDHGVSEKTVRRAAQFFHEVERTPELKAAVAEGRPVLQVKRELKEQRREERREENRQKIASVPVPTVAIRARYATIVIDPPWDWGDEGDGDQLGRARPDYGTMSIDELSRLDVPTLADVDCHLYLWITNRSLPKGFRLLEAWGFRYVTALTWVKPHFGMGNYFRGQTEHVLFAVRGSQPLKRRDAGTVFHAARGSAGHSSKPPEFLELVESCSPGPYLEMFARSRRDGWVTWGQDGSA